MIAWRLKSVLGFCRFTWRTERKKERWMKRFSSDVNVSERNLSGGWNFKLSFGWESTCLKINLCSKSFRNVNLWNHLMCFMLSLNSRNIPHPGIVWCINHHEDEWRNMKLFSWSNNLLFLMWIRTKKGRRTNGISYMHIHELLMTQELFWWKTLTWQIRLECRHRHSMFHENSISNYLTRRSKLRKEFFGSDPRLRSSSFDSLNWKKERKKKIRKRRRNWNVLHHKSCAAILVEVRMTNLIFTVNV